MARKPDAATFFSSDENFTLEHQFADILEADRQFEKLKAELDDLLDEIDEVLESNAEDFVRSYVQKGGQ